MAKKAPARTADKPPAADSNDVVETTAKKKKPRPLTYTGAVGDIRAMFLEQASLWRAQAEILEEKAWHGTRSAANPSTHEPWASLLDDDRKRPSLVFEQNDESSQAIRNVREKLKRTRQWEYKRPEEEEEEASSEAIEENSDDDHDGEADA